MDGLVCYSFEGRIKDNINRGGEKIGAEEIEGLVVQHPDIMDVRVVAMPDPFYGEKACAYLIMHAGKRAPTVPSSVNSCSRWESPNTSCPSGSRP